LREEDLDKTKGEMLRLWRDRERRLRERKEGKKK